MQSNRHIVQEKHHTPVCAHRLKIVRAHRCTGLRELLFSVHQVLVIRASRYGSHSAHGFLFVKKLCSGKIIPVSALEYVQRQVGGTPAAQYHIGILYCLTENVFLLLFVLFFLSSFIESALTSFQVMVKQQFCKSVSERSGRRNLKVGPVLNYFELDFEKPVKVRASTNTSIVFIQDNSFVSPKSEGKQ